jgi:YesN/AraC family two-component response regulator
MSYFETYNPVGREDFYLIYVVEGELLLDMANIKRSIGRGTAFIVPPKHMYKYSGNPSTSYLFAHFTGSYAEDFLKECGFDNLPIIIENEFSAEVQGKFLLMIDTFLHNDQLSTQKCACMLQEILISICESSLENSNNIQLKTSLKHIHSFFTSKISVPYLASLENLSNSRYVTVFKKQMGKSPNEYIIDLRLQFAKSLLENTNMSIKQISERIGYPDQYFFSRLFKKYMGVSPQKYRKENLL